MQAVPCHGEADQRWRVGLGAASTIVSVATGKCAVVPPHHPDRKHVLVLADALRQAECDGQSQQLWVAEKVVLDPP